MMPCSSSGHDWIQSHNHVEGSGTTGQWTSDSSGGSSYSSSSGMNSSSSWSNHFQGAVAIFATIQTLPLPGYLMLPLVLMVLPVILPTTTAAGPHVPNPIDAE